MSIRVSHISKSFGRFKALDDVSFTVNTGEMVALLGPSGSGKTTLLRVIAGLERANAAPSENPEAAPTVQFFDEDVTRTHVGQRRVGFVFQHYALFRHMTVFENVAFGLRVRSRRDRPSKPEIADRVNHLLKMVQLEPLGKRYPSQLSGGQRQRVALARALAVEPKVLLLDEPFGALDAKVRKELRRWLRKLQDETKITSVFVTHDQEEALEVADRVAVMSEGKIVQIGTPQEVYDTPVNEFVYRFLGEANIFIPHDGNGVAREGGKAMFVRPHDVEVTRAPVPGLSQAAIVKHINAAGPVVRIQVLRDDTREIVDVEVTRSAWTELNLTTGDRIHLSPRNARVFEDYSI